MTDKHKTFRDADVDPIVSAEYQALANDATPGKLNRAILRASRIALQNRTGAGWRSAWLRPVAGVAVVALSLAVMLEFSDTNNPDSPFTDGDEIIQLHNYSPDGFREAADGAAGQLREADEAASRAAQNSAPGNPPEMSPGANLEQSKLPPIEGGCDGAQRSTTATWWQCIELLESRGASALAEQELAALLGSYPAFAEPGQ